MVTGIETAGLILAILPMLVNQLDNYARGLEKIKALRRYRREMEGYATGLSAQYAILLNTLELSLEDVVDDHDERAELISNPKGPGWKDELFQKRLTTKLGRDYHVFIGIVGGLCSLLEELSHKLGLETTDYTIATSVSPLAAMKFRKTFSRAIYEDMLDRIDKTNQILKTLSEQSHHRQQTRRGPSRWKRSLKRYREGRRHAKALYDIMVRGHGWKCPCKEEHSVCLQLGTEAVNSMEPAQTTSKSTSFLMMLSSKNVSSHRQKSWYEVELESDPTDDSFHSMANIVDAIRVPPSDGRTKVHFTTFKSHCVETTAQSTRPPHIADLCSTLREFHITADHVEHQFVGQILHENPTAGGRYNMRLLRSFSQEVHMHSLHESLMGAPSSLTSPTQRFTDLSRRDRLCLAALLASSVLQLHGGWLKQQWRTQDIFFVRHPQQTYTIYERPYLLWKVLSSERNGTAPLAHTKPVQNNIQNDILFPLALALIELSLGRTISALYCVEDEDVSEGQAHFNTATRVLKRVYWESGTNYGDVVKECLYWSRSKGEGFEDPRFDEAVFSIVVSPLLEDFDYFEGVSHGR
ncbi:hypothetical protein BDV39DRAFT_204868 [Aspergillus sergii]|uniref:DUF7580 domain-containing protein n=1 Tax=Aspergillus sergii TaxID=1034303 RepID=A0A5N6X2V8_9EURO|nr:hypothetical protein BDV39DRAFT_204868 [Aspergillus sergii]